MADGAHTDSPAHKPNDQVATPVPHAADGHVNKLQAEANPNPPKSDTAKSDVAKPDPPKDGADKGTRTQDAGDKGLDRIASDAQKAGGDAYGHLTKAQQAANEIAAYIKGGHKEGETVTVKGADGKDKTEKLGDRIAELKKTVDTECSTAVGHSANINQKEMATLVQSTRNDRNQQARDLGLDPNHMSKEAIVTARKTMTDAPSVAKLDKLAETQQKLDSFQSIQNAPAYTRMLYASFKGAGLTDPESGMVRDAGGSLKASQKDVLDAVQLLSEAGTNKELRNSKLYVQAVSTIMPKLENGSERTQAITKDLDQAVAAGAKGNKVEQERLLKDAVNQADQTNTAAIAQLLRDPRFVESQQDKTVVNAMATSAVMGNTARLQYAQFLAGEGKFHDAQGLVVRVAAEMPEVLHNNKSTYFDLTKLNQQMSNSSNVNPGDIKNLLDNFNDAMGKGKITGKDGAHELMDQLKAKTAQYKTETADGQNGLTDAQKRLDERTKEFNSKTWLTDDAKKIEQQELQREALMIQDLKKNVDADVANAKKMGSVVKLYEAGLDVSEENRASARALLAEVKKEDPSLAAATQDGKPSFFATLDKAAQEPGWWDRNWRKVAFTGAIVAGAAVGALTCWTGPGALVFGAGTTAALATTFGLGIAGGAVAGAATFAGTHEVLYATGNVKEKVNFMADVKQGAQAGALGAFITSTGPLMEAAGALPTAAGTATNGARALSALQFTGRALAINATGGAINEGISAWADGGHTMKQSAENLAMSVAIPTAAFGFGKAVGVARAWNKAEEAGNLMTKASRFTTGPGAFSPEMASALTSKTNLFTSAGVFTAIDGIGGVIERTKADQMGPLYAYGEGDGTPSPISQSTSLFGPYNNTRGLQAERAMGGYNTEGTQIQSNYQDTAPSLDDKEKMTATTQTHMVDGTNSVFTDADALRAQEVNQQNQPDQANQ